MNKRLNSSLKIVQETSKPFSPTSKLNQSNTELLTWLQSHQISSSFEQIPEKFSNGVLLCQLITKLFNKPLKCYKTPSELNESKFNIRIAMSYLRSLPKFKSDYMWNEEDIFLARGKSLWPLLHDLKSFLEKKTLKLSKGIRKRARSELNRTHGSGIMSENKRLSEIVKTWLEKLGICHLINESKDIINNTLRNGVLLCSAVNSAIRRIEFCKNPKEMQEVYCNIQIAFNVITEKIPIKKLEDNFYTEAFEVWKILHTLMLFFPYPIRKNRKFSEDLEKQALILQKNLIEWVTSLGVTKNVIRDFQQLIKLLKTGEILAEIVNKILHKDILGITHNPKTEKVCVMNIEKVLKELQNDRRVDQENIRDAWRIYNGDCKVLIILLEDLRGAYFGMTKRKRGKSSRCNIEMKF